MKDVREIAGVSPVSQPYVTVVECPPHVRLFVGSTHSDLTWQEALHLSKLLKRAAMRAQYGVHT